MEYRDTLEIDELTNLDYDDLDALPTLREGWTADLKVEHWQDGWGYKVWIERLTTEDGCLYDHQVEVEVTDRGRWWTFAILDPAELTRAGSLNSIRQTEDNPYREVIA